MEDYAAIVNRSRDSGLELVRDAAVGTAKTYVSYGTTINTCTRKYHEFKIKYMDKINIGIKTEDSAYFLFEHLISSEDITEIKKANKIIVDLANLAQPSRGRFTFRESSSVANAILYGDNPRMECLVYADYICMFRALTQSQAVHVQILANLTTHFLNFMVALSVAQRRIANTGIRQNINDEKIKEAFGLTIRTHKRLYRKFYKECSDIVEVESFCSKVNVRECCQEMINSVHGDIINCVGVSFN